MSPPWKQLLVALTTVLLLGIGFILGRRGVPGQPQLAVAASPRPAPPKDAPPGESDALRHQLADTRVEIELLRREIADQDRRRQALEAELAAQQARPKEPVAQPAGYEKRLADFRDLMLKNSLDPSVIRREGEKLTRELLGSPEAQRAYLDHFEKGSKSEALFLWDVGFGTFLGPEENGKVVGQHPEFRDALEGLRARTDDPEKRQLLETLLKPW